MSPVDRLQLRDVIKGLYVSCRCQLEDIIKGCMSPVDVSWET